MRVLPHPLLTLLLVLVWLVLTSFSLGQLILGALVGVIAGRAYAALTPDRIRLRRPDLILRLALIVAADIARSNIAVARLILTGGRHGQRHSGFVPIPLDLREPNALAILAIIVTATPGTAWLDYEPDSGELLLHVFDLVDEAAWVDLVKNRYEALLLEIFQ
ncbi:Na+/H+ antiporter subunit E [Paracoccus luteus]|uniref:Na+/H+ antiporter subunit E n=1 Tax=Paracoccus luteus TaxID=2508543 RepID=UPI00106F68C0|nr:Na+/H+ antiporter subunit E [Paracoccus luteus]